MATYTGTFDENDFQANEFIRRHLTSYPIPAIPCVPLETVSFPQHILTRPEIPPPLSRVRSAGPIPRKLNFDDDETASQPKPKYFRSFDSRLQTEDEDDGGFHLFGQRNESTSEGNGRVDWMLNRNSSSSPGVRPGTIAWTPSQRSINSVMLVERSFPPPPPSPVLSVAENESLLFSKLESADSQNQAALFTHRSSNGAMHEPQFQMGNATADVVIARTPPHLHRNFNSMKPSPNRNSTPGGNFTSLGRGVPFALSPAAREPLLRGTNMASPGRASRDDGRGVGPRRLLLGPPSRDSEFLRSDAVIFSSGNHPSSWIDSVEEGRLGALLRTLIWVLLGLFSFFLVCRLERQLLGTEGWAIPSLVSALSESWWLVFSPLLLSNLISTGVLLWIAYEASDFGIDRMLRYVLRRSGLLTALSVGGNPFLLATLCMLCRDLEGSSTYGFTAIVQPQVCGCCITILFICTRIRIPCLSILSGRGTLGTSWVAVAGCHLFLIVFLELLAARLDGLLSTSFSGVAWPWFISVAIWVVTAIFSAARALIKQFNLEPAIASSPLAYQEIELVQRSDPIQHSQNVFNNERHPAARTVAISRANAVVVSTMLLSGISIASSSVLVASFFDSATLWTSSTLLHRALFPIFFCTTIHICWFLAETAAGFLSEFLEVRVGGEMEDLSLCLPMDDTAASRTSTLSKGPLNDVRSMRKIDPRQGQHSRQTPQAAVFGSEPRWMGLLRMGVSWLLVAFCITLTFNANSQGEPNGKRSSGWWAVFIPKFLIDLLGLITLVQLAVTWWSRGFTAASLRYCQRSGYLMCAVLGSPFTLASEILLCCSWQMGVTISYLQIFMPICGGLVLVATSSLVCLMTNRPSLRYSSLYILLTSLCALATGALLSVAADGYSLASSVSPFIPLWVWCAITLISCSLRLRHHWRHFSEGIHRTFTLVTFLVFVAIFGALGSKRAVSTDSAGSVAIFVIPSAIFALLHTLWAFGTSVSNSPVRPRDLSFTGTSTFARVSWVADRQSGILNLAANHLPVMYLVRVRTMEAVGEWVTVAATREASVELSGLETNFLQSLCMVSAVSLIGTRAHSEIASCCMMRQQTLASSSANSDTGPLSTSSAHLKTASISIDEPLPNSGGFALTNSISRADSCAGPGHEELKMSDDGSEDLLYVSIPSRLALLRADADSVTARGDPDTPTVQSSGKVATEHPVVPYGWEGMRVITPSKATPTVTPSKPSPYFGKLILPSPSPSPNRTHVSHLPVVDRRSFVSNISAPMTRDFMQSLKDQNMFQNAGRRVAGDMAQWR